MTVALTPGTGKIHPAIALAMRARQAGHRMRLATAGDRRGGILLLPGVTPANGGDSQVAARPAFEALNRLGGKELAYEMACGPMNFAAGSSRFRWPQRRPKHLRHGEPCRV